MTGLMVVISGILAYTLTSTQLLQQQYPELIDQNANKMYHALTMAFLMGAVMSFIMLLLIAFSHRHKSHHHDTLIWIGLLIFFIALYCLTVSLWYRQVGVDDADYIRGMIEHHGHALAMSVPLLKNDRVKDPQVRRLIERIVASQSLEIDEMKRYLRTGRFDRDVGSGRSYG